MQQQQWPSLFWPSVEQARFGSPTQVIQHAAVILARRPPNNEEQVWNG